MRIDVGNDITGVNESEAAKGRRDLADFLDNWWLSASQKTPAHAPEKLEITWGKMKCQLELSVDQAKSPQIAYQSAPPSVREVLDKFLLDTCHVESVEGHLKNKGLEEKVAHTATNIASKPDFDDIKAPLAQFRAQFSMFKPAPSEAPKKTIATPEPTIDDVKKGGPSTP